MNIRKAIESDIEPMWAIYKRAQKFMAASGNPSQWGDWWPPKSLAEEYASERGNGYVVMQHGKVVGAFGLFANADEEAYHKLDGKWSINTPYAVIHTLASDGQTRGVGEFVLNWAVEQYGYIRLDTHKNNTPMLHLMQKLNFTRVGEFDYDLPIPDTHRVAFEKVKKTEDCLHVGD